MKRRCPKCGHQAPVDERTARALRSAERELKSIGAVLQGPYCIQCQKAGRGDVLLVEEAPAT